MHKADTLTAQEQLAKLVRYDLGPGYPRLPYHDAVAKLYRDESMVNSILRVSPEWTANDEIEIAAGLRAAVQEFLGVRAELLQSIQCTFSGSVALDRGLAAAIHVARGASGADVDVITTTPSIDIMKLIIEERSSARTHFAESRRGCLGRLSAEALLGLIDQVSRESHGRNGIVVALTSPENPTGEVWAGQELEAIGAACFERNGVLVVDHSFLLAGVHERADVSAVWERLQPGCDWLALWDTGKTFGLNEDKLGFLIPGSFKLSLAIEKTLNVLQFDVARRQKVFFAMLFALATKHGLVDELRRVCRQNLATAVRLSGGGPLRLRATRAGSLALAQIPARGESDDHIRQRLWNAGVGVASGSVFFHTDWRPEGLIRVALAREPEYFEQAFALLTHQIATGAS